MRERERESEREREREGVEEGDTEIATVSKYVHLHKGKMSCMLINLTTKNDHANYSDIKFHHKSNHSSL